MIVPYLSIFKNISINCPLVTVGDQRIPFGSVINMIRSALDMDELPSIDNKQSIDRFDVYRIVSGILDGRSFTSQWYYKYPSIIASMCLVMPQKIGDSVTLKELKSLVFPYTRLIEDQNRLYRGIVEDVGQRFEVLSAMGKISTSLPRIISPDIDQKRWDNDRVSRFKVGSKTPDSMSQHFKFISSGDRYSLAIEHKDNLTVTQLGIVFEVPAKRYFKNDQAILARLGLSVLCRRTGELKRIDFGKLLIRSCDRVLRIRLDATLDTLSGYTTPEKMGYLLSVVGFRRSVWETGSIYTCTNIPLFSPLSDIPVWNSLGFTIAPTSGAKIKIDSISPPNRGLIEIPRLEKQGKADPIVVYR